MQRIIRLLIVLTVLAGVPIVMLGTPSGLATVSIDRMHSQDSSSKTRFQNAMRKLWEDHITWTRLFIVSALADLPDKAATTQRLLQNQVDIGNAVKPYYGVAAGEQLATLLKEHITIAAGIVTAAKGGDKAKQDDATKRWYGNADEIAAFLSSANPRNWPASEMKSMMREHLDLTAAELVARLKADWAKDIQTYDTIHEQILKMAGMLSSGIINQFPDKF